MTRRHVSGAPRHNHPGTHHAALNGATRDAISPSISSPASAAQAQGPNQQDTQEGNRMDRQLTRVQLERWLGIGRSTIYRRMRTGEFPLPRRIGGRAVRWSESEIERWLASRPRSTGDKTR